ncbi:MAG: dihydroorotate dehydrogenase-like protein [Bacteroidales bacterium]
MIDLSSQYMGLELKNPIIVGSCGLTGTVEGIQNLEKHGAGAVVLKSIFEEEILLEANHQMHEASRDPLLYTGFSETLDYIDVHIRENNLTQYLDLIRKAKKTVDIPIIASVNCVTDEDWTYFTRKMEEAGADALELNLFLNPADFDNKEFEGAYFRIVDKILKEVDIPVSIKASKYLTRMGLTLKALSATGISGMVLFNRFFTPDIDIDQMELATGKYFTGPEDMYDTLRWITIMSGRAGCDLAASTGIHGGEEVVKMLLAGAMVTQISSTLYKNGPDQIAKILKKLTSWMESKSFKRIEDFRGKVAEAYEKNPAALERMQFMKHYSEIR